ncbi:MAG: hypothetical protein AAF556_02630 [Pseudomonadota bacterium]
MSELRNRSIDIVVDTTKEAEADFAHYRLADDELNKIARNLKAVVHSKRDIVAGNFRLREVTEGWGVLFAHYLDGRNLVVLIVGYGPMTEMESMFKYLARAAIEQAAPGLKVLLEGRKEE